MHGRLLLGFASFKRVFVARNGEEKERAFRLQSRVAVHNREVDYRLFNYSKAQLIIWHSHVMINSLSYVNTNKSGRSRASARAREKTNIEALGLGKNYPVHLNVHAPFPARSFRFRNTCSQKVKFANIRYFVQSHSNYNTEAHSQKIYEPNHQTTNQHNPLVSYKFCLPIASWKNSLHNSNRIQSLSPILTFRQLTRKQLQKENAPFLLNNHLHSQKNNQQPTFRVRNRFGSDHVISSTTTAMTTTENYYDLDAFQRVNEFEKAADFKESDASSSISLSAFSNPSLESNQDGEFLDFAMEEPHKHQAIGSQIEHKTSLDCPRPRNGLRKKYKQNDCVDNASSLLEKAANQKGKLPKISSNQQNDKRKRSNSAESPASRKTATPTLSEMAKSKSDFASTIKSTQRDTAHNRLLPLPLRGDIKR